MNYTHIKYLIITAAISILLFACANALERDAQHLAMLQKERVEIIKQMLQLDDSLQSSNYHQKLLEITTAYKTYKNQVEMKYKNEDQRARFEKAYREALE